jgi:hypothetical protein
MKVKPPDPFVRNDGVDEPGIIGSVWWNESLMASTTLATRRKTLATLAGVAGVLALGGLFIYGVSQAADDSDELDSSDFRIELKPSLQMQQGYGWHFGSAATPFVFTGAEKMPYDKGALPNMAAAFEPARTDLAPYYQRVLAMAPSAKPTLVLPEPDAGPFLALADALVPIQTTGMASAYLDGEKWAKQLAAGDAVVVDLPGEEAVAFAAGTAERCDPVLLFDNWPHPKGVVPAHVALAAMAYYQPRFAATRKARPGTALPVFVLDRQRLARYANDTTEFDNRWAAKLPEPTDLKKMGVKRVIYCFIPVTPPVLPDVDEYFVRYLTAGLAVVLGDRRDPQAAPKPYEHPGYFVGFREAGGAGAEPFGKTPVYVQIANGTLSGSKLHRGGSWNRVPSYSGGG